MNILHILFCGKSGVNGITQVVNSLANAQRAIGMHVEVATLNVNKVSETNHWKNISDTKKFKSLLKERRPDLVVFHSIYLLKYIYYSHFLINKHIPYIITFHGGASADNYKKNHIKKFIANILFFNSFVKHASAVIYLNTGERNKSIFRSINPTDYIIPNGIKLPETANPTSDYKKQEVVFLFLSRMDFYGKGLDVLRNALRIISERNLSFNIRFRFYGHSYDGTEAWLDEFGDFAKYYGVVYDEDKVSALKKSQIMILPSRSEGMPLSILEGLSYGLPALVTPETNMGDLLLGNKCGWLSELDAKQLAATIITSAKEYLEDADGFKKRSIATARQFDWLNIAKTTEKIYDEIIVNMIAYEKI